MLMGAGALIGALGDWIGGAEQRRAQQVAGWEVAVRTVPIPDGALVAARFDAAGDGSDRVASAIEELETPGFRWLACVAASGETLEYLDAVAGGSTVDV